MPNSEFIPIRFVLANLTSNLFPIPEPFDSIGIADLEISHLSAVSIDVTGTVQILGEIGGAVPLVDGVTFVLLSGGDMTEIGFALRYDSGNFDFCLTDLSAGLRIDSDLLVKVDGSAGNWVESADPVAVSISGAQVCVNQKGEFDFTFDSGAPTLTVDTFMIGDSGVVVETSGLALVMSQTAAESTLPDGMDDTWRGVYIEQAKVYLPEGLSDLLPDDVTLEHLFIGSGGFCGTITGDWTDDPDTTKTDKTLCGMAFKLKTVSIEFKQNTLVDSSITGELTLPFFEGPVDVTIGLTNGGDFTVGLESTTDDGLVKLTKADLLELTLDSLAIEKEGDLFYVTLGGSLEFLFDLDASGQKLPTVKVDGLRISSEGKISIEGGGISLERQTTIKLLQVFDMEVDAIGMGTEDAYNFISFSGGIQMTKPLPAGVSAKGLRVMWDPTGANPMKISCEGIGVNFEIKDTLTFEGAVALGDDYLTGKAKINVQAADLCIDVGVVIGKAEDANGDTFKYLGLIVDTQLPVGIPLASTGLAFYGFGGLFAGNMVPLQGSGTGFKFGEGGPEGKETFAVSGSAFHWFNDWYLPSTKGGWGQPWTPEEGGIGLGTGTTIGTLADNGFTFAMNLAFVFAFPGPILMLQGKGNLLKDRSKLGDGTELFDSLIIFDGNANSILAALGMAYKLPADSGAILDASANSEAFFDFDNPENWHVYLGQEEKDKRIRADVLSLFQADAYLMVDNNHLKTGTSIGFEKSYDYTVASVELYAWLYGDAEITWVPQHLHGELGFDGKLSLNIAGVGISMSAEAGVEAQTPTPKELIIDLTVSMDLPWPFDPLEVDVHMEWKDTEKPDPVSPLLLEASISDYKTTDSWELDLLDDAHDDNADDAVYEVVSPLDARPVLIFNRDMRDTTGVPLNTVSVDDEEVSGQTFGYELTELKLAKWDDDAEVWVDQTDLTGYWQATGDGAAKQLELYGDGPFSFCRHNTSMADGDASAAPNWIPYTDSFLSAVVGASEWPLDMTPTELDFSGVTLTATYGPTAFSYENVRFTPLSDARSKVSFKFKDMSAYVDGGYVAPIDGDSLAILEADFGGRAWPKTVRAIIPKNVPGKLIVTGIFADGRKTAPAAFTLQNTGIAFDLPEEFYGVSKIVFSREKSQAAYLLGFSYLTSEQLDAMEDMAGDAADLLDTRATLEADVNYRLKITTKTSSTTTGAGTKTQYAFFKTEGPPADLTPYVSRAAPETGTLHYRGYDLTFEFDENYIQEMYAGGFAFAVDDENAVAVKNADGTDMVFASANFRPGAASVAYTTKVWLGALADMGADPPDESSAEKDDTFYATLEEATSMLPASKTLDAVVSYEGASRYSHRFRTSAFVDFEEMIGTHQAGPAPYQVGAAGLAALAALSGSGGGGTEFDSAWYDAAEQSPTELRAWTESAIVTDETGAVVGLYVEFPESVDWARVSVVVTGPSGTVTPVSVRSSDGARLILLQAGTATEPGTWTSGPYILTFTYTLDMEDAAYPVLYRYGQTAPEMASITVTL